MVHRRSPRSSMLVSGGRVFRNPPSGVLGSLVLVIGWCPPSCYPGSKWWCSWIRSDPSHRRRHPHPNQVGAPERWCRRCRTWLRVWHSRHPHPRRRPRGRRSCHHRDQLGLSSRSVGREPQACSRTSLQPSPSPDPRLMRRPSHHHRGHGIPLHRPGRHHRHRAHRRHHGRSVSEPRSCGAMPRISKEVQTVPLM